MLNGGNQGPVLNYVIRAPKGPITLDVFDAERYASAVVVQPLIGTLIYYSNKGRYEPKLASTWQRLDSKTWSFELREGQSCENGEAITATSFKASLERSIRYLANQSDVPIFDKLEGFEAFVAGGGGLSGIKADGNRISFRFSQPIRSGLLEILSFAPFGYICDGNLNPDGSWKDQLKLISSGPYKVSNIKLGELYELTLRSDWKLPVSEGAPSKVVISHAVPPMVAIGENYIFDQFTPGDKIPDGMDRYQLVPEYINSVLLGNFEKGYFGDPVIRKAFKSLVERFRDEMLPPTWDNHFRSSSFYPNQVDVQPKAALASVDLPKPKKPLLIEGTEPIGPDAVTARGVAWKVLKAALQHAGIEYRFNGNESVTKYVTDPSFDIRVRGSSIGGGVEPWVLAVLFHSQIGIRFPDPSHNISRMVDDYEGDAINDSELRSKFLRQVEEDAAIIPISHYGMQMHLSKRISTESLSPLMCIMRFDQIRID